MSDSREFLREKLDYHLESVMEDMPDWVFSRQLDVAAERLSDALCIAVDAVAEELLAEYVAEHPVCQ